MIGEKFTVKPFKLRKHFVNGVASHLKSKRNHIMKCYKGNNLVSDGHVCNTFLSCAAKTIGCMTQNIIGRSRQTYGLSLSH